MRKTTQRRALFAAGLTALAAVASAGYAWRLRRSEPPAGPPVSAEDAERIRAACSRCHGYPAPDIASKSAWQQVLPAMYKLASTDPNLPSQDVLIRHYQDQAPNALTLPRGYAHLGPGSFGAAKRPIPLPLGVDGPSAASIRPLGPVGGAAGEVIVCDLSHNEVVLQDVGDPGAPSITIASVPTPVHTSAADLDDDGIDDLIVSSIGEFEPSDTDHGKIIWLRGTTKGGYEPITIADKVGRVIQAEAADMDGDGDKDVVVAEFGYRDTGKILVLKSSGGASPSFQRVLVEPRPGTVAFALRDLNGDGALDIVAAIAQEHETIMAYLNRGGLDFGREVIFKAPHPAWGMAGMDIVDIDGDGDLDVLSANGDSLDSLELKPYHGVYLSKNEGHFPWPTQLLAPMPGAYRVRAGDLDADGDLDVAAVAFVPPLSIPRDIRGEVRHDSVIWLEQRPDLAFQPHSLEAGGMNHVDVALLDADADGDLDVLVTELLPLAKDAKPRHEFARWMTLFENASR